MRRCATCDVPGPVVRGGDRAVTSGTVAGRGERIPIVSCGQGHGQPVAVAEAALDACRAAIPHAAARRLRRNDACGACGQPLTMPVRRTERAMTLAEVEGVPVTTLRFDLPTTRCPACGTDQVPTRSQADLAAVVAALFGPAPSPG